MARKKQLNVKASKMVFSCLDYLTTVMAPPGDRKKISQAEVIEAALVGLREKVKKGYRFDDSPLRMVKAARKEHESKRVLPIDLCHMCGHEHALSVECKGRAPSVIVRPVHGRLPSSMIPPLPTPPGVKLASANTQGTKTEVNGSGKKSVEKIGKNFSEKLERDPFGKYR